MLLLASLMMCREEGVGVLRVVDLGAGLLSMLPVLAQAGGKAGWTSGLDYTAYEVGQPVNTRRRGGGERGGRAGELGLSHPPTCV